MKTKLNQLFFLIGSIFVNAGNYGFNLILGRIFGTDGYAEVTFYSTMALTFSFIAVMFQMTSMRYCLEQGINLNELRTYLYRFAIAIGSAMGIILVLSGNLLCNFFNINSIAAFVIIAISLPFYFIMSVERGFLQGNLSFRDLAITYQIELWTKIIITLLIVNYFGLKPISIIIGISMSFFLTFLFTLFKNDFQLKWKKNHLGNKQKEIFSFFATVGIYELSQILINNSDVLLAKTYLDNAMASQYAALAMIGRIVFFSSFPIIMILIPILIKKHNDKEPYLKLFYFSILAIIGIISMILLICFYFSNEVITVIFGTSFIKIAPYLWQYALTTGLFTCANVFIYFYLSVNNKTPVILSITFGLLQVLMIIFKHATIDDFIFAQLVPMSSLLLILLIYHFYKAHFYAPKSVQNA